VDPVLDLSHSAYAYMAGDPLNGSDPGGLCFWCDVVIGAVVVGSIVCFLAEPCGLVEAGAAVTAGGALALGGGVVFVGGDILVGGAAIGALGGAVFSVVSSAGDDSSSSSSSSSSDSAADQADEPDCAPKNVSTRANQIAQRFGHTVQEVNDAIHKVKRAMPRDGQFRNPDVMVDLDTGEVYVELPDGSPSGDSIGNILDYLE
jgi:hypothetical protein